MTTMCLGRLSGARLWCMGLVPVVIMFRMVGLLAYLPTIPDSPELLRKSTSNYGITARGRIITDILDYGNI